MVGGTTPSRVIQVRFPESCPQPSLAKQAVLTHRPGYFCLDNAFALIDGAIQKNDRNATASSNRHILCVRRECEQSKAAEKACAVREGVWSQSRQGGTRHEASHSSPPDGFRFTPSNNSNHARNTKVSSWIRQGKRSSQAKGRQDAGSRRTGVARAGSSSRTDPDDNTARTA